jgi:hypothetical protein
MFSVDFIRIITAFMLFIISVLEVISNALDFWEVIQELIERFRK